MPHLILAKPSTVNDRENDKELLLKAEAIGLITTVDLEGSNYNMESEKNNRQHLIQQLYRTAILKAVSVLLRRANPKT